MRQRCRSKLPAGRRSSRLCTCAPDPTITLVICVAVDNVNGTHLDGCILQDESAKLESRLDTKEQLQQSRQLNVAPAYLSEEDLSKLESSVKKNTTLNKKLRALNDSNLADAVIKDITSTNQSRFLPEAAIALVQGTLKVSSVAHVMRVCCHAADCCHQVRMM